VHCTSRHLEGTSSSYIAQLRHTRISGIIAAATPLIGGLADSSYPGGARGVPRGISKRATAAKAISGMRRTHAGIVNIAARRAKSIIKAA